MAIPHAGGRSCERPVAIGLALLVLSGYTQAQTPKAPPLPEGTRALRDLAYVPEGHARQKLDLFVPADAQNLPLLVWIHGGAWRGGDKGACPALRFLRLGYAVASVNYRLSQDTVFPAQIEDCKAAIRWLRTHASEYGYDGNRIGVWGSSAGGHLVALLGTSGDVKAFDVGPNPGVSSRVQAVCDFFGPTDLLAMRRQSRPESTIDHDAPKSPESLLIGGPIQDNKDKAGKANPILYISADDPPFLIMHGDRDNTVPIGQSELLYDALRKAHVEASFHVVKGAGHGFGRNAEAETMVTEFFARHLKR